MEAPNAKLQKAACLLLLFLLCSLAVARQGVPDCCRQKTCSCRIYDLLHGMGNHAAGILTLGKRKSGSQPFQSRLYRLLQGSGNHAAGILTMGRRAELAPDHPVLACHNASGCPSGTDTQPTPARGASDADPSGTRECMGQMGKDSTKSQDLVAAKSFY